MRSMFSTAIYTLKFMRFCLANFVVAATVLIPLTFLVHKAELGNINSQLAALLLSFAGLSSSAGQIILGLLASKWVAPLYVYVVALSVSGLVIIAMAFMHNFVPLAILSAIFGFSYGAYYALMSVLLIGYVNRDLFTPALAVYAFFQGGEYVVNYHYIQAYGNLVLL
jgi:MFS family permease